MYKSSRMLRLVLAYLACSRDVLRDDVRDKTETLLNFLETQIFWFWDQEQAFKTFASSVILTTAIFSNKMILPSVLSNVQITNCGCKFSLTQLFDETAWTACYVHLAYVWTPWHVLWSRVHDLLKTEDRSVSMYQHPVCRSASFWSDNVVKCKMLSTPWVNKNCTILFLQ